MEVLREDCRTFRAGRADEVSILVLMEVLREGQLSRARPHHLLRFNPCFNGSVERGPGRCANTKSPSPFQSLF